MQQTTLSKHFKARPPAAEKRRTDLRAIATETLNILPTILSQIPEIHATKASVHHLKDLSPLNPTLCPGFTISENGPHKERKGTRIRVLDKDSFDAALDLQPGTTVKHFLGSQKKDVEMEDAASPNTSAQPSTTPSPPAHKPVALLNLANARHPGGGWLNGALAQEESLCYRSSLSVSLQPSLYPIPSLSALYTPSVVMIREAMSAGHDLLYPSTAAHDLPMTTVITAAAKFNPRLGDDGKYARSEDREIMAYKIRVVLRVAALHGHTKIVLGALGCGAFGNPPLEVAHLFLEVFQEDEFRGGWWEDVVFAVMDNARSGKGGKDGEGNFGIFYRALDGAVV
jgi:uncharacterized protein (TIGR02452 family)